MMHTKAPMDNEQDVISGLMTDAEAAIAAGARRKAASIYAGVLGIEPNHVLALRQLAGLALSDNRIDEAIALFEGALNHAPGDPDLYHGIGTAMRLKGSADAAIMAFKAALQVDPRHHPALFDLARIYQQREQFDQADALYDKASIARWNHFESILNRGVVLFRQDRLPEAERWFHHAGLVRQDDPRPLMNLAMIYRSWGQIGPAVACLERAVELAPDNAEAHWNLANALLVSGQLKRGFVEYEWRFLRPGRGARAMACPRWDGRDPRGKTILVAAEQGLGDAIHFARFAKDLSDRGATVVLECQPGLERLLATVPGVSRVIRLGVAAADADMYVNLMSLPHLLGLDAMPPPGAYLKAPARRHVIQSAQFKVGIAWRGNPSHENDRHRSINLELLAPVFDVPGVQFYSLQMGDVANELTRVGRGRIEDLCPTIGDFADTAALVEQLDLVISVDTALAHLTGGLGKPAWILLARGNDWRWFHDRDDSPWYPNVRLFRQAPPRYWAPAIKAMVQALSELAGPAR